MIRKSLQSLLGLFVASTANADRVLNMPKGVTELSAETYELHMIVFWWCVGIGVVVFGVMIYSLFMHRKSRGAKPATFSHSTTAEFIWTIIPVVILLLMAVPTAETMIKLEDSRNPDLSIVVTGYQWKWSYDYLGDDKFFYSSIDQASYAASQRGSGIDPATVENYLRNVDNAMVVPVDKKVRLLLTASDVIHSWWVPELYVKKDANPGFINETWFEATKTGIYRGPCTELCGRGHGFMPVVVVVATQENYEKWLAGELRWDAVEQELVATANDNAEQATASVAAL